MIPIILNDRCTKIFSKIINETESIKLSQLCEDFNVSYRTIRYDIQKINDFLECNNLPKLVVKPNVGVIYNNSPDIQKRAVDTIEKI